MDLEYADKLDYFVNLISSDLVYLNAFYKSIYDTPNAQLAAEFSGFVY